MSSFKKEGMYKTLTDEQSKMIEKWMNQPLFLESEEMKLLDKVYRYGMYNESSERKILLKIRKKWIKKIKST